MPRTARRNRPGLAYHVIWRFVDRAWYFRDDEERGQYLRLLGRALELTDWRCFAYALMSSHVHLYLCAGLAPMSSWTKRAHSYFAQWLNRRHERIGPVFADRPTDYAFLPSSEPNLLAYIHNNPVRAGVVQRARDSTWTSHRAYIGLVRPPTWLRVDEGRARTGLVGVDVDSWLEATPGMRHDLALRPRRGDVRKLGAVELGSPLLDQEHTMVSIVARPFAHVRMPPSRVVEVVAILTGCDRLQLCSPRKHPALVTARAIVARVGCALGIPKSHIASALGLSAEAVHRASTRELPDAGRALVQAALDWLHLEMRGMGGS
ncbi:MAG: hypothetical protein SFX73_03480 [Kofleriaceae bacterium]|nr:hypothetical protein [Kofleriaceae bacterium]